MRGAFATVTAGASACVVAAAWWFAMKNAYAKPAGVSDRCAFSASTSPRSL